MSASVPGRAVYERPLVFWWNAFGLTVMVVGGSVAAVQIVREGDPRVIAFIAVWFGVLAFIARGLLLVVRYRLEADDRRMYWRRRGTEESVAIADVESVSITNNIATFAFRDGTRGIKTLVGGGFYEFLRHLTEHQPELEVRSGWSSKLGGRFGGFSRS